MRARGLSRTKVSYHQLGLAVDIAFKDDPRTKQVERELYPPDHKKWEEISEIANKYQKRFIKNNDKLFTFLHYDTVPWNNNNAEHAIKGLARYRKDINGKITELGLNEYLILLSIYKTCEYKGVNFLDFLLSKETDMDKYYMSNSKTKV